MVARSARSVVGSAGRGLSVEGAKQVPVTVSPSRPVNEQLSPLCLLLQLSSASGGGRGGPSWSGPSPPPGGGCARPRTSRAGRMSEATKDIGAGDCETRAEREPQ